MLNKVKSVYNDFLDNLCVCVCVLCEPLALFSCEYTLNGSHCAHINHTLEQIWPSQGNLFYTFTVY